MASGATRNPRLNVLAGLGILAMSTLSASASAMPLCLSDPTAQVGNSAFGATVQTFVDLGVSPESTCIENALWTEPENFGFGSYVGGANGFGGTIDPTGLNFNGATVDGTPAGNANALDFFWVQDTGATTNFGDGVTGGAPSAGIVWDLGGQANQAVVFVQVDHGPVPGEVLENTIWLSDDPAADDAQWKQASLSHIYADGWSPDPNIADGFAVQFALPDIEERFRYVSVSWGGPGAILRDGDNEIDAVGGLNAQGGGVQVPPVVPPVRPPPTTPPPVTTLDTPATAWLVLIGVTGLALRRTRPVL